MGSSSMIYFPRQLEKTPSGPRRLIDDNAFVQLSGLVNIRDPRGYEI